MTPQMVLDIAYMAIATGAKMAAPVLITSIIAGIVVNLVQTITSVRDMSLTFVPKVVAAGIVIALSLPWSISVMTSYFQQVYSMFGMVAP